MTCEFEGKLQGRCDRPATHEVETADGHKRRLCREHGIAVADSLSPGYIRLKEIDNGIHASRG